MNNNVFQHFQGYELLIKTLDEGVRRYKRNGIPSVYGFVGLDVCNIVTRYLGNEVEYMLYGGYDKAFSKFLVIGDNIDPHDYMTCLKAPFNPAYNSITHRDVLGAVYSLGIDERQFGDMWVEEDAIYLYCDINMASYIVNNLTQIRRARVQFQQLDYFPEQQFKFREFQITVSSMRLDRVLSAIIHKSREKCQKMIRGSMISVNYQTIEDCDHLCNNSDVLSVRGTGRFLIGETVAQTRSGNLVIRAKQFI